MRRSSAFGIGSLAARPPTLQVVGGGKGNLGFEVVYNWTVVNNDATTQTLTVTDINGAKSVFSIVAGASSLFKKIPTFTYALSGSSVGATASWPTEADPSSVLVPGTTSVKITSSITLPTDVGQGTAPNPVVTPTAGDLTSGSAVIKSITNAVSAKATIYDSAGNLAGVSYGGDSSAPAGGVWRFVATVTEAGTPLTVNGAALLPVGFSAAIAAGTLTTDQYVYEFPVTAGTTYIVAGGAVVAGVVVEG